MKTIIVYYSYSGNNESLAKELRLRFGCDLVKIEEEKRRTSFTIFLDLLFNRDSKIIDPNVYLDEYKTVIFLAPIWDSKIAGPLCTLMKKEKKHINSYAFITSCGGRDGQKEKIIDQLYQLIGKKPIAFAELKVNDLLPEDQRGKVKYITPYRIKDGDFVFYNKAIQNFVNAIFAHTTEPVNQEPLLHVK